MKEKDSKLFKRIVIFELIVIFAIAFFANKAYLLVKYDYDDLDIQIGRYQTLNYTKNNSANTYDDVLNASIYIPEMLNKKDTSGFSDYNGCSYYTNDVTKHFSDSKTDIQICDLTNDINYLKLSETRKINLDRLFKFNKIKSNKDLLLYALQHNKENIGPFSSANRIVMNYVSKLYVEDVYRIDLSNINSKLYVIDGDVSGFYSELYEDYEAQGLYNKHDLEDYKSELDVNMVIEYKNKAYYISINDVTNSINSDTVKEIINSIN